MVIKKITIMKLYELKMENINFDGLTAISIVEFPAIEENFVYFSKDKKNKYKFAVANEEKRIITGPAMIPDKKLYRIDEDTLEDYYVYFSKDTIERVNEKFMKENKTNNITLEHQLNVNNVNVIESWIINDKDNDKANSIGFKDLPKGTWMLSIKIDNDNLWNNMVKSGLTNGFSIEGYFSQSLIKNSEEKELKILKEIYDILKD